jgi:alkylation response protein AidB-like acyl-CoA dehydrogenase
MAFFQPPPALGNQYTTDRALRSYLTRALPPDVRTEIEPELAEMGELAGGSLYELGLAHLDEEPRLTQWDAWGNRVDRIDVTRVWEVAMPIAIEKGLVATAYERKHGEWSRIHQHALLYLFHPSSEFCTCPLGMADGAAKTLLAHGHRELIDRAVSRLTSRNPAKAWSSGQWMTERIGGSDVARSETMAKKDGDAWRLYGTKWFTSAVTAQMALTLARPEGSAPGGPGLALFYVELRDDDGRLRNITVNRLKDKLGTRQLPTGELTLDGALAIPVAGLRDGVKNIAPMLNVTRSSNAVASACSMRRALALAADFARKRVAFGSPLSDKPLHVDTLAGVAAEFEGALLLGFRASELLGREEEKTLTEEEGLLLRLITPVAKAVTAKQAVAGVSEVIESFGGAGYVEDTGLPRLLRDAQVLPIWEGTTNVLSLELLRGAAKAGGLAPLEREVRRRVEHAHDTACAEAGRTALEAVAHARAWLEVTAPKGPPALEAGARRFNLTLGRALELALLVDHAAWAAGKGDGRPAAAARRFARSPVDLIVDDDLNDDSRTLAL